MAKMIDIEFIQKWVNISEEELMQRLVKDAVGLMDEARKNCHEAEVAKRRADNDYDIEFVKQFYEQYDYLSQFFSDEEILNAVQNHMGKRDLTEEEFLPNAGANLVCGRFVKYDRRTITVYRGSWQREEEKDGAVYLIANKYQGINGSAKVIKELMELRCPWTKEYDFEIYASSSYSYNDYIFVKVPEDTTEKSDYSSGSLYVPFSALMTHDADKIVETHCDYWHGYGRGKYDAATESLLQSDFIKGFFDKVKNA